MAISIRFERVSWAMLEEISAAQGVTVPKFLSKLHDEVLESSGARRDVTSLLRCACRTYVVEVQGRPSVEQTLLDPARRDLVGSRQTRISPPA